MSDRIGSIQPEFFDCLRCPDCGERPIRISDSLGCPGCSREFSLSEGVWDFMPKQGTRLPKIYEDPNLRQWRQNWTTGHEYFYETRGPISWVQNAGHRTIARYLRRAADMRILEVGCGDRGHLPFLEPRHRYLGLDMDIPSLGKLARHYSQATVLRGDSVSLPLASESFDCVLSIYHLEHVAFLEFTLEELCRVLKRDGRLLASIPAVGGAAWEGGARLTSHRHFTKSDFDYARVISIEHLNVIWQVDRALRRYFDVEATYFPTMIPSFHANLIITYACRKQ